MKVIVQGMQANGYDRDQYKYCMKVEELWQPYQRAGEAKSQSGPKPQNCRFYNKLLTSLGEHFVSTPQTAVDTSEEPETQTPAMNREEDAGDITG